MGWSEFGRRKGEAGSAKGGARAISLARSREGEVQGPCRKWSGCLFTRWEVLGGVSDEEIGRRGGSHESRGTAGGESQGSRGDCVGLQHCPQAG